MLQPIGPTGPRFEAVVLVVPVLLRGARAPMLILDHAKWKQLSISHGEGTFVVPVNVIRENE